jgi:hypothetical protein
MSETLKSSHEPHQTYAERQRVKRLKDKRKRIFKSIAEYEAMPDVPADDPTDFDIGSRYNR